MFFLLLKNADRHLLILLTDDKDGDTVDKQKIPIGEKARH